MAKKPQRLKKELGLLNVFMIATGTTLSAGFFLLPGIAFESAGPAITLAYIIAAIPLIPAMLSIVELSTAMPPGAIQVPPLGEPILLMADRQTAGGYPRIATVITSDIPVVAQLAPGDWIEFAPCDQATALRALIADERSVLVQEGG